MQSNYITSDLFCVNINLTLGLPSKLINYVRQFYYESHISYTYCVCT